MITVLFCAMRLQGCKSMNHHGKQQVNVNRKKNQNEPKIIIVDISSTQNNAPISLNTCRSS